MKNKKEYLDTLSSIQEMVSNIRTMNEAINFGESYDDSEMPADDVPAGPEGENFAEADKDLSKMDFEQPDAEEGLNETGEVDQIRELALRGMIKLCKNPEDERYQALKRIFTFCDKAVEPKKEEQ